MAQSQVRLKCPSCAQNLRLVNVPADKKSIRCPLCNARVSLSLHQRAPSVDVEVIEEASTVDEVEVIPTRKSPPPRRSSERPPPRRRSRYAEAVERDVVLDDEDDEPAPSGRRKRRKRKQPWTFVKTLRLTLAVGVGMLLAFGLFINLLWIAAVVANPNALEGSRVIASVFGMVFWTGVGAWLANVFEDHDWSSVAKQMVLWGFVGVLFFAVVQVAIRITGAGL